MRQHGLTLFELLITLVIAFLILGIGIPGFSAILEKTRTKAATYELLDAIKAARSLAVHHNSRAVLRANGDWQQGWQLFEDLNHDGQVNGDERVLSQGSTFQGVNIKANTHVKEYISFVGTGEGRKVGNGEQGAFQVGTIKICPEQEGRGYALVLSVGGRTRLEKIEQSECAAL